MKLNSDAIRMSLLVACAALLAGCGGRADNFYKTAELAFSGAEGVQLSEAEIEAFPYAAQYASLDDQPQALIALGFDDDGYYSWFSGNQEVFTTFNGRVIQTEKLPQNLIHTSYLKGDPLRCWLDNDKPNVNFCERTSWVRESDISYQESNKQSETYAVKRLTLSSSFKLKGETTLQMPNGVKRNVIHVQEMGEVKELNQRFTNNFWIDREAQRVVKSRQWLGPQIGYINLTEVKSYTPTEY